MPRTQLFTTAHDAVVDIPSGARLLVGGFRDAGAPEQLLQAIGDLGIGNLTLIHIGAGHDVPGVARLFEQGQVSHLISTFARGAKSFEQQFRAGSVTLELVPMGTLAERIRAAGAGISAFFTPTAAGTDLSEGKETRVIDGRLNVLETALHADFALIHAQTADDLGNLTFRKTARSMNPVMAAAGARTIVQARRMVPRGSIDPETVVTPGVYVDRVVDLSKLASR